MTLTNSTCFYLYDTVKLHKTALVNNTLIQKMNQKNMGPEKIKINKFANNLKLREYK